MIYRSYISLQSLGGCAIGPISTLEMREYFRLKIKKDNTVMLGVVVVGNMGGGRGGQRKKERRDKLTLIIFL